MTNFFEFIKIILCLIYYILNMFRFFRITRANVYINLSSMKLFSPVSVYVAFDITPYYGAPSIYEHPCGQSNFSCSIICKVFIKYIVYDQVHNSLF